MKLVLTIHVAISEKYLCAKILMIISSSTSNFTVNKLCRAHVCGKSLYNGVHELITEIPYKGMNRLYCNVKSL